MDCIKENLRDVIYIEYDPLIGKKKVQTSEWMEEDKDIASKRISLTEKIKEYEDILHELDL